MQAEIILLHSLQLYTIILKSANHRQVLGLFLQKKHLIAYTGEAIIPELIVKDGTKELEKDVDYEIKSIANGTNVGTATVTIVGKGD